VYKSFIFVLFNESFPNPAKFQIWPKFGRSQISAGFVKKGWISARAGAEPNFDTALVIRHVLEYGCTIWHHGLTVAHSPKLESAEEGPVNHPPTCTQYAI